MESLLDTPASLSDGPNTCTIYEWGTIDYAPPTSLPSLRVPELFSATFKTLGTSEVSLPTVPN